MSQRGPSGFACVARAGCRGQRSLDTRAHTRARHATRGSPGRTLVRAQLLAVVATNVRELLRWLVVHGALHGAQPLRKPRILNRLAPGDARSARAQLHAAPHERTFSRACCSSDGGMLCGFALRNCHKRPVERPRSAALTWAVPLGDVISARGRRIRQKRGASSPVSRQRCGASLPRSRRCDTSRSTLEEAAAAQQRAPRHAPRICRCSPPQPARSTGGRLTGAATPARLHVSRRRADAAARGAAQGCGSLTWLRRPAAREASAATRRSRRLRRARRPARPAPPSTSTASAHGSPSCCTPTRGCARPTRTSPCLTLRSSCSRARCSTSCTGECAVAARCAAAG